MPALFNRNRVWKRNDNDFAQRIEIQDVHGIFKREVTIMHGTKAIFLQGGRYVGVLDAGVYNLGNITYTFARLNLEQRATVILMDAGIVELKMSVPSERLRSRDNIPVSLTGRIALHVTDPEEFLVNYLKNKDHLLWTDITKEISDYVLAVVYPVVVQYNEVDLNRSSSIRSDLQAEAKIGLTETLERKGLSFDGFEAINFSRGEIMKPRIPKFFDVNGDIGIVGGLIDELDKMDKNEEERKYEHERKRMDAELKYEREHIYNLNEASPATMLHLSGATPEQILELQKWDRAISLTPDQITAMRADPVLAATLISHKMHCASIEELTELRIRDQQKFNQMLYSQYRGHVDEMKEILNAALRTMGSTATVKTFTVNY